MSKPNLVQIDILEQMNMNVLTYRPYSPLILREYWTLQFY